MATKAVKIKNGAVKIPGSKWRNTEAMMIVDEDTVMIKRMEQPSLADLESKLRKVGRNLSKKDIDDAVKFAKP